MFIIQANGLLISSCDKEVNAYALRDMVDYLDKFNLPDATFEVGHSKIYLTRDELIDKLKDSCDAMRAAIRRIYRRGLISYEDMEKSLYEVYLLEI